MLQALTNLAQHRQPATPALKLIDPLSLPGAVVGDQLIDLALLPLAPRCEMVEAQVEDIVTKDRGKRPEGTPFRLGHRRV